MNPKSYTGSLATVVVSALLLGATPAQAEWRWAAPIQRRGAETVDDIIRRRGFAAQPLGTNTPSIVSYPKQLEVIKLRRAAHLIGERFGQFNEKDGILTYSRDKVRIQDPVRKFGGETVVLGPETPRFWIELISARVLNNLENGLLVEFADMSMLIKNWPQHGSTLPGGTIAGWVRLTTEEYPYTTVGGVKLRAVVADYGESVTREEAADAILRLAGEWESRADSLKRQADGIKEAENRARDERVRKFREEQEARRRRQDILLPTAPAP